jgi:hypothetical protein
MTKINIRSPFYLRYDEPALPSVALDCNLINLQNMSIDQFGNVTLPDLDYGTIISYTSSDVDFANGKFDTVVSATSRTVTFTISIPVNFSNAGDNTIDCDATFTQPAFVCTGGVTTSGSIPSQALDTGGDSVEIDLTSYFTAGTDPIEGYNITNSYSNIVSTSLSNETLKIFSINRAGTATIFVEAYDSNEATCNATQSISITVSDAITYDCNYAFFVGGSISNLGVITNPSVNGTITAIKETSGGASITSYPANNTGSAREVTLYFDITVPSGFGYTNAGATVECSKTFTQSSTTLPQFTCSVAGLTGQAVAVNGTIKIGTANVGTISGFSPLSFPTVTTDTERTVAFNITPPASGYANSGGSDISCNVTMTQPAPEPPAIGTETWYISQTNYDFLTRAQLESADYPYTLTPIGFSYTDYYATVLDTLEGYLEKNGTSANITTARTEIKLNDANILNNIGSGIYDTTSNVPNFLSVIFDDVYSSSRINPTGGLYFRVNKAREGSSAKTATYVQANYTPFYFIKVESNFRISEVWNVDLVNRTFTKLA